MIAAPVREKKCFRRVQFSFCEAKLFMMAANEQIKSAVCLPKNKQLADFFLLCEMETERIAISSLAYAIFRMDGFSSSQYLRQGLRVLHPESARFLSYAPEVLPHMRLFDILP